MSIGQYRDQEQARQDRARFASLVNLAPSRCLVSFYGFPTLPAPPLGAPDGTGRLPAHVSREWAGHPAFWLSPMARRRQPDEINQAYIIRLWVELLVRGYWDNPQEDQGWVDVLRLAGLSPGDPEGDQRLVEYAGGAQDDDDLNCLELAAGMTGELPPEWVPVNAKVLYCQHELAYQEVLALRHDQVAASLHQARSVIVRADPAGMTDGLLSAASLAGPRRPDWQVWQQAQQQAQQVRDQLDHWADQAMRLGMAACATNREHSEVRLISEARRAQRHDRFIQLMNLWRDGSEPDGPQVLAHECDQWAAEILAQGRTVLDAADTWDAQHSQEQQRFVGSLQQQLEAAQAQAVALDA
jgi:hypothetical protein